MRTYTYKDGHNAEQESEMTNVSLTGIVDMDGNELKAAVNREEDSTTGDSHIVTIRDGKVTECSCPAFEYHCGPNELCVHGAAVQHGHVDNVDTEATE